VFTVGHSTRPIEVFIELLLSHGVRVLLDTRTVPRSRHNPQFEGKALAESLRAAGIEYRHEPRLGGLRKPAKDSANKGWRNASFRGYADHMGTPLFAEALGELISLARERRVAVMCAEGNPFRCHRSLIADALLVRGVEACEITGKGKASHHRLTPFAQVEGERITYPERGADGSGE
jgi:uncharacterized protein (DUF488 family)